ncbi:MAG: hypothetical protein R3C26_16935 [Calditrichia bacterium]
MLQLVPTVALVTEDPIGPTEPFIFNVDGNYLVDTGMQIPLTDGFLRPLVGNKLHHYIRQVDNLPTGHPGWIR